MKQFEYRTVELYYQVSNSPVLQYDDPSSAAGSYQTHTLDTLGEQGWELVALTERPASSMANRTKSTLVGVFKREKRLHD